MNLHDLALMLAGLIGAGVALVHGVLVQRLMVGPLGRLHHETGRGGGPVGRLIAPLLQFSTTAWALGGVALVWVSVLGDPASRTPLALYVGALYLVGAVANFYATRGRHPGWISMTVAVALIGYGISG